MATGRFLNDDELTSLARTEVLVEGLQGLVKVDRSVALARGVKLRIGAIVTGTSSIGEACDIGLAGGAIVESCDLGKDSAVTGGGKMFQSVSGPHLRNYGSQMRQTRVGANFVIRSMAETRNLIAGNDCRLKMFCRIYDSQLGDENVIGSHSLLSRSRIGDRNTVGDYTSINNCVIGDKVVIGNYTHIKAEAESPETIIEDNVKIGDHVIVHPGTRIYSGTKIPDYALVFTRDGKTVMSLIDLK